MFHSKTFLVILLGLITFAKSQHAFSLSGPLAPWQTAALGYAAPIPNTNFGGPMNLDEEYRWNVPTVHYGFTADFLNFFGVRGAEEIEKAIAVLNDLPEADNIHYHKLEDIDEYNTFVEENSTLLSLCSHEYDEGDYIRNYEKFIEVIESA